MSHNFIFLRYFKKARSTYEAEKTMVGAQGRQVAAARSEAEAAATDEIAALRAQAESAPSAETGRLLSALKDANGHVAELRRVLIMLFVFVALAERVVFDYIPAESYRYTR